MFEPMAAPDRSEFFVSTQWLEENLAAPDLKVIDGSYYMPDENKTPQGEFEKAHVPGAVFFDIDQIADKSTGLPHMLPDEATLKLALENLGVGDGTRIVVYDTAGLFVGSARVWWTLKIFGAKSVKLLEGGLPKWQEEGRKVETGPFTVTKPAGGFTAKLERSLVANTAAVQDASATGNAQILDARTAPRFAGDAPEPRAGLRSGHIPGSLNLPWREVVGTRGIKPAEDIKSLIDKLGLDLGRPVITTCGSGVTAAILLLALETVGKRNVSLYDGSWTEWGGRNDLPVALGVTARP